MTGRLPTTKKGFNHHGKMEKLESNVVSVSGHPDMVCNQYGEVWMKDVG